MKKCKKCNATIWSGKGERTFCIKCQIGDQNPAVWLLEKVHKSLCENYAVKPHLVHYKQKSGGGTLTYNARTGECVGNPNKSIGDPKDFVCIMVRGHCDNKKRNPNVSVVFHCWTDNGFSSYKQDEKHKISSLENFVAETLPLYTETLYDLLKFAQRDTYVCYRCQHENPSPGAGRHFAGIFCQKCWEVYKTKNSRTCGKCRSPIWKCCC